MNRSVVPAFLAVHLLVPAAAAVGADVTACGQTLSGSNVMIADLDCTSVSGAALEFPNGGSLDLAGFTLTARFGVVCSSETVPCSVTSSVPGGTILGSGGGGASHGIHSKAGLRVGGVTVTGFSGMGVYAFGRVTIDDSVVTNNEIRGVFSGGDIRVSNSIVSGNGHEPVFGVGGPGLDTNAMHKILVRDSTISGSGSNGIEGAGIIKLDGAVVTGNTDDGIAPEGQPGFPAKVNLKDSIVSANGSDGLDYLVADPSLLQGRLTAKNTTFDGNGEDGVRGAAKARIRGGGASNNGAAGIRSSSIDRCRVSLVDAELTGNGEYGAFLGEAAAPCPNGRFSASGSTLAGNDTSADCGITVPCADIAATAAPTLGPGTTCERSYVAGSGVPGSSWSVCSLD